MKRNLHRSILAALGTAALATASTHVGAFPEQDLGTLSGQGEVVHDDGAPYKSYTDYSAKNHGWVHTADFYTFRLGTNPQIAAGAKYNVTITMKGRSDAPLDNPAFTLWTLGTNAYQRVNNTFHSWGQLRGPNDKVANPLSARPGQLRNGRVVIINNVENGNNGCDQHGGLEAMGVVDGHAGWIGYAQSGPTVTVEYSGDALNGNQQTALVKKNGDCTKGAPVSDSLPFGWYVNRNTPYVNGARSSGSATSDQEFDEVSLTLKGLQAGNYLIGAGGSCGTPTPAQDCATGQAYQLKIFYKKAKN